LNVLVAGGTGLVGRRLCEALVARGDVVTVVTRDPARAQARGVPGASYRGWLPALDGYDGVVNLCGEPIFGRRWNAAVRQELRDSRVLTTRRLVAALREARDPPHVLVNASAIGFYGSRGDELLTEDSAPGTDFMAQMCQAWEAEAHACPVRTVVLRIGIVLGEGGGALAAMLPFFRLGLGGPIGLGGQWFSWVHVDDVAGLILDALDDEQRRGAINATSPGCVTNRAFSFALGRVLRRPAFFPVPPLALRLKFGPVASVLSSSQRCAPRAALRLGYEYRFPELDGALRDVLRR
jgi:uncharacterized protein (TIGR01777 family)